MKMKTRTSAINWKRVLREIYDYAPSEWGESNKLDKYSNNHALAKKLKISGQELGNTISFLENQKVIETQITCKNSYTASWVLTEKGFNIARENQNFKLGAVLQTIIIYLTTILVITGMFDLFSKLKIVSDMAIFVTYVFVGLVVAILSYILIFRRLSR